MAGESRERECILTNAFTRMRGAHRSHMTRVIGSIRLGVTLSCIFFFFIFKVIAYKEEESKEKKAYAKRTCNEQI